MESSSINRNLENDPQVSNLVVSLFDKYVVQPTAHLPITSRLRKQLHDHFKMPDSEPETDGQHKLLEEEPRKYSSHLHNFFVDLHSQLNSKYGESNFKLRQYFRNLLVQMQAELEYPPGRLDELFGYAKTKSKLSLKRMLEQHQLPIELIELLQTDWKQSIRTHQNHLAEERACRMVDESSRGKRLDLRILVSNLFAGAFILAIVAGAAPQLGQLGYIFLAPFLVFGMLCTYLWVLKDGRLLAAFLTGLFTLSLTALGMIGLSGSTHDLLQPAFVAAGCGLGGLLGLYSGWWEWRLQMDQILLDEIFELKDQLLEQELLHPKDLASFGTEKVMVILEVSRKSLIREMNLSLQELDKLGFLQEDDFENLFETKKRIHKLKHRVDLLQAVYEDLKIIMIRMQERVEILKALEVAAFNPYPLHLEDEHQEANHQIAIQIQDLFLTELENIQANIRYIIQNPATK